MPDIVKQRLPDLFSSWPVKHVELYHVLTVLHVHLKKGKWWVGGWVVWAAGIVSSYNLLSKVLASNFRGLNGVAGSSAHLRESCKTDFLIEFFSMGDTSIPESVKAQATDGELLERE